MSALAMHSVSISSILSLGLDLYQPPAPHSLTEEVANGTKMDPYKRRAGRFYTESYLSDKNRHLQSE